MKVGCDGVNITRTCYHDDDDCCVVGVLQSNTDQLQIKAEQGELNGPPHLPQNETRHMYPGLNQTTDQLQTKDLIPRIDTLETDMKKHADAVHDNSKRLGWIETIINHESEVTYISNETNIPSCVDFATLNKTVIAIEVKIDKYEITHDVLHNYTTRLTELGMDMYVNRNSINQLTKAVSELNDTMKQPESIEMEKNINQLTKAITELNDTVQQLKSVELENNINQLTKAVSELNDTMQQLKSVELENNINQLTKAVSELNDTMKRLESVEFENNSSLNNNEETIRQLEASIEIYDTRLTKLETNDIMNNATLVAHISEVAKLQSDQLNDRDITTNLTVRVMRFERVIEKQNYSEELENSLIQLVLNISKLQNDIKENGNEINVLNEIITSIQDIVNDFNETLEKRNS